MSKAKMNDLIDNEKFEHYFQALYDLESLSIIGYEALLRTKLYKNPEILFEQASQTDRFFDLELRSIRKALQAFNELVCRSTDEKKLLINVFPSNLIQEKFITYLDQYMADKKFRPDQVIIEINESDVMNNVIPLLHNVSVLKEKGFLIAIDDVGKGVSSLQAIVELQPDFVKMDRYFAHQLASSNRKQEMVRSIVTYCLNTETEFVLEGIEILEDLEMAKSIGVSIVQGFLLAEPKPLDTIKCFEKKMANDF
ncbi:EAL domain, c-di-GMP-specific phosphodiesterase class I (or its enzymatically inactive variant) [Gracilibacillus ureilyticus]|uniref:EAL domain, c-di-GMP-specific phosphodiesterase class I (Or its enzymatically inactive variant) n=1 Tax=Gracilibacillus ureilyticus TaxID=531814 RepID=A0A1H9SAX4_9BACI|nr:EAL domain-containing protein [Gracilibacillus ureilyticus]SER81523.1 EAL domain, c-di-GMP-specific phosphodiesterase class I (or its enzymatically inactive variant) [Gracilibacillus ureilyticus]